MENTILKKMKVVSSEGSTMGYHTAYFFDEFYLQLLRPDINSFVKTLGDKRFTDLYFKTSSGNIYRIYQENNISDPVNNWVLINKRIPQEIYIFSYNEMCYGRVKIGDNFHYGVCFLTTRISDILVVNRNIYFPSITNVPESKIVQEFGVN